MSGTEATQTQTTPPKQRPGAPEQPSQQTLTQPPAPRTQSNTTPTTDAENKKAENGSGITPMEVDDEDDASTHTPSFDGAALQQSKVTNDYLMERLDEMRDDLDRNRETFNQFVANGGHFGDGSNTERIMPGGRQSLEYYKKLCETTALKVGERVAESVSKVMVIHSKKDNDEKIDPVPSSSSIANQLIVGAVGNDVTKNIDWNDVLRRSLSNPQFGGMGLVGMDFGAGTGTKELMKRVAKGEMPGFAEQTVSQMLVDLTTRSCEKLEAREKIGQTTVSVDGIYMCTLPTFILANLLRLFLGRNSSVPGSDSAKLTLLHELICHVNETHRWEAVLDWVKIDLFDMKMSRLESKAAIALSGIHVSSVVTNEVTQPAASQVVTGVALNAHLQSMLRDTLQALRPATIQTSSAQSSSVKKGVCYQFRDKGRCRFGNSCRFAHVAAAQNGQASSKKQRYSPY